ncbi:MAG: phosphotransferase [Caldilineaceae bacterium]
MSKFIPVPEQPTAEWLTAVLQAGGHLPQGEVTAVEVVQSAAFNSHTSFLQLHYSSTAPLSCPARMVLKQNRAEEWAKVAGAEEVKFYQLIATLPDHPAITVPCYAAAYDEMSGASYLLLQDMSATHVEAVPRDVQIAMREGVPSKLVIGAVVDTLAQLHAYWWEHPLLSRATFPVGFWSRNAERFALYLARRQNSWARLSAQHQDWFPAELRTLYENLFAHLHGHWERYLWPRFQAQAKLTLIHGDAYFANFLTPKEGATGRTYLIDWQSPGFGLGAYDLVNLCATFWSSAQRNQLDREMSILQRYHHGLLRHGVTGYGWEDLLTDYRSGLIFWLLMPVQDGADGAAKSYWWPKLQCLVTAYQEWECERLLEIKA